MKKKYTLGQRINGVINLLAYFFIIVLFISFVFLAEIPEGGSWIDTKGGPVIILIFLIKKKIRKEIKIKLTTSKKKNR